VNQKELRGLIQGPIATLPTPMKDDFSIDHGVMAELSQWWVANGLVAGRSPLKVAAAMGEGPDLSDDEWPALLKTVVDAAGPKAAVMCALKTKNTFHTIEDAKRAQDLGAIGLQIDLPIFHHPNQDDYVRYFTDISDAIEIGIMIYNTFWFGAPSLTVETMKRLADAEKVVAVKWNVPAGEDYDSMKEFSDRFNVIDNASQPGRCIRNGGRGFIDSTTTAYPAHALAIWDAFEAGDIDGGQQKFESVTGPFRSLMAKSSQKSGGYRMPKGLMAVMGHPVGPPRPPTLPMDADELAELRDLVKSFGWLSA
jgi:4-hydroxy-tetrahydrodipicolinate synthase